MNGCGQHSMKLQTIINNHRKVWRALHVAWVDITNADGSVRPNYLKICLKKYKVPAHDMLHYDLL